MSRYFISGIILLGASICFSQVSQDLDKIFYRRATWLEIGVGWGGQGNAFQVNINKEVKRNLFLSAGFDFTAVQDIFNFEDKIESEAVSLNIGHLHRFENGYLNISLGLSYVKITDFKSTGAILFFGTGDSNISNTIGLSFRAGIFITTRRIGVGISPFLNINPEFPYGGLTLNISGGILK